MTCRNKACQSVEFGSKQIKAGMFAYALAFLLGVVFVQQLSNLPTLTQLCTTLTGLAAFVSLYWIICRRNSNSICRQCTLNISLITLIILGYTYASFQAHEQLQFRLNEDLIGKDLLVTGTVSGIPASERRVQRFDFHVERLEIIDIGSGGAAFIETANTVNQQLPASQLLPSQSQPSQSPGSQPASTQPTSTQSISPQALNTQATISHATPEKIRLSWYNSYANKNGDNKKRNARKQVSAGEKWQFEVRLKPPHGFSNPGGFDYEGWLFQHGIQATGYIRQSALNQKYNPDQQQKQAPARRQSQSVNESYFASVLAGISKLRQSIGTHIDAIAKRSTAEKSDKANAFSLIKALAIGDKSAISKQQWRVLSATGTSHLMAISGLHIGLAALLAYVLIRRLVPVSVMKIIPAQHVALIGSVPVALSYALIAGLSIPTQRAFVMLFILSMMMLIRRNHRPLDALGFALLIILLLDPIAVLSAGFWFSFSAVAVIFISLSAYSVEFPKQDGATTGAVWQKIRYILIKWIRLQFLISLFLLPLSLFMFQQVSLISPLVNLLLIPYVSFLVVPLVLLALCLNVVSPDLAGQLFSFAASLLDLVWPVLTYLSELPYALWLQGDVGIVKLLVATAALCLIYFSKPLATRLTTKRHEASVQSNRHLYLSLFAFSLFVAVFYVGDSRLQADEFKVTILDVGQGSAAVVQTKSHVAIFDTGAKFSKKLDAGSGVVIPYLRSQGIGYIDRLIISHGDADHIGGSAAVLEAYPAIAVLGQDIDKLQTENKQLCYTGYKWQWDGVDFEILSPTMLTSTLPQLKKSDLNNQSRKTLNKKSVKTGKRNNKSCVLRISSSTGTVLFTGDIEKKVELALIAQPEINLKSDVLVVPHHGSKTSSSVGFIEKVEPELSIISVGYKNRYKLPNKQVVSRYLTAGSQLLRTDQAGAITVEFTKNKEPSVEKYREKNKRYWHHAIN